MEKTHRKGARKEAGMKKNSKAKGSGKAESATREKPGRRERKKANRTVKGTGKLTIGMDLGDKTSRYCVLDEEGEVLYERSTATTKKGMTQVFGALAHSRVAMEVGTHSRWVSRLLKQLGHEVIVANARKVRLISQSSNKDDRLDAKMLGRLARVDPELLCPIQHRSEQGHRNLVTIRVRAALVEARTSLVNAARGMVKAFGERIPTCDADQMGTRQAGHLPAELQETLKPLLEQIESLTEKIKASDQTIEQIARQQYPETARLRQVSGVGDLIALTYVLTVEDPHRFQRSRDVGALLGLRPKRQNSGDSEPELRITKEGDSYLRKLLVQGAHYIVGRRGPDTDLKRWGQKLAGGGGKNAKKRAVVAVARKLAVLLHKLWVSGEKYEPLRNSEPKTQAA
jgi:transposase